MTGYYLWELNSVRYGRLSWSVVAHHLVASFVTSRIILFDAFSSMATVYGLFGVGFTWCIDVSFLLRNTNWGHRHPDITRKSFVISYYTYIFVNCICNLGLQVLIIVRCNYRSYTNMANMLVYYCNMYFFI